MLESDDAGPFTLDEIQQRDLARRIARPRRPTHQAHGLIDGTLGEVAPQTATGPDRTRNVPPIAATER